MTSYETIFTRRSVRQYDSAPLGDAELADIQATIDGAKQLPGQTGRFIIVNADRLKGAPSPHAILAHGEDTDAALSNSGYVLSSLDLYLQSKGCGSIVMGMAKPLEPAADYCILLAFGSTTVPARNGEADFKRRSVADISNEDNAVARAARLAPSAVNFQPWRLEFSPGKVVVKYTPKGIGKLLAGKMQKIDVGIITKYVELALEHEGKTVVAVTPQDTGKYFRLEVAYAEGNFREFRKSAAVKENEHDTV
jgi:nitroreductase